MMTKQYRVDRMEHSDDNYHLHLVGQHVVLCEVAKICCVIEIKLNQLV